MYHPVYWRFEEVRYFYSYLINCSGPAKCPKCRNAIQLTIPNKSIDAAISECLANIKAASESCLAHVVPNITPVISESQDINLWSTRYDENEAEVKAKAKPVQIPTRPQLAPARPLIPIPARIIPPIIELDNEEDDDEGDDDDEDEDEDADTRYDGSAAFAEYARSNRSRCIMCNQSIANRELRIGVTESYEYHDSNTRFIHVRCIRDFNQMVSSRQRIQVARMNLRGVSQSDAQQIRNSF